jgi:hypothetical protein
MINAERNQVFIPSVRTKIWYQAVSESPSIAKNIYRLRDSASLRMLQLIKQ